MQRKIFGVLFDLVIACSILSVLILTFGIQPVAASGSRSTAESPTNRTLISVYMLSSTDGWAVGEGGTIIRWNGSSWSTVASPTKDYLMSVYMLSRSDGWAVGFPPGAGWAVGIDKGGTIIRWDGSSWSNVTSPTTSALYSVYMLSSTDGWAVGYRGTVIRWDGSSWSTVTSPTKDSLLSVYMLSPTNGWAVGDDGAIIRWNGSFWSRVTSPTRSPLLSVYMLSSTDGWAVGYGGTIIRWDGSSWSTVTSPTRSTLYSVYMVSPTDGWAVGGGGTISGTIIRWDGSSWSIVPSAARSLLLSAYMVSPSDGWAVGYGGAIQTVPPAPNQPPVVNNQKAEGQANPTHLVTLTPVLSWDYYDADNHAQEKFWVQVGTSENDGSLWDYVSPDWKELEGEVYYEPFDNLDNFDFDHPGAASVEIDPPGQLHYYNPGGGSWGHAARGWDVPNNFTFEIKTYFDRIDKGIYYNIINSATIQFAVGFTEEGLLITQEHIDVPNWDIWNLILPGAVTHGKRAEWQTWRFVVTGDNWETASCDIYLTDSEHTNQLMAEDIDSHVPPVPHGAGFPLSYETGGRTEVHIDYAKIISNDSGVKIVNSAPKVTYGGSQLSRGVTYHWRVKCYDGDAWSSWASGTFKINSPPTLTSGGVSPSSGTPETPLTYQVTYIDADGDAPSYVRVYVDEAAENMSYVSGTYTSGALYRYTTTLNAAPHTYYFEASDGFATARAPENGTLSGPVIKVPSIPTPAPTPTPRPTSTPTPTPPITEGINWWLVIGIVAGVVIIGLVMYFFIRRRVRK